MIKKQTWQTIVISMYGGNAMKTLEEYKQILELHKQGYNFLQISKQTNISRYTIKQVIANPEIYLSKNKTTVNELPELEHLKKIISESISLAEVLNKLNMGSSGNAYRVLKKCIKENNINTSHFLGQGHGKGVSYLQDWVSSVKIPIEQILVENSTYQTSKLSKRLRKEKILEYKCSNCGLDNSWNDRQLNLHLDHINGISNDHRLCNLRYLCPNCHSQTDTYCGRNIKKK